MTIDIFTNKWYAELGSDKKTWLVSNEQKPICLCGTKEEAMLIARLLNKFEEG